MTQFAASHWRVVTGGRIISSVPEELVASWAEASDAIIFEGELCTGNHDADGSTHSGDTVTKVYHILQKSGFEVKTIDSIVNALLSEGILFRERS